MKIFIYFVKMRILTAIAYRFEVFSALGTNLILMFATVFLWKSAYSGIGKVEGLNENQMITYAVFSILLASVFTCDVQNIINYKVREGEIAVDLFRPINIFVCYLAEDIAVAIASIVNKAIPILIISLVFFRVSFPSRVGTLFVFMISCLLSYGILWLMSVIVGMTAFWILELGNMGIVKDAIVKILSGSLIPLWFFPKRIQNVSDYLPFKYTYQIPLSIYIEKVPFQSAAKSMLIQFIWIIILFLLFQFIWNFAKKRVMVQGG